MIFPPVDKPEPPHSLTLSEKANRSVTVSWSRGNDNNSPVSGNAHILFHFIFFNIQIYVTLFKKNIIFLIEKKMYFIIFYMFVYS